MSSDAFAVTYEMRTDAPAPMDTDVYIDRVCGVWEQMVENDPDEPAVQGFLQDHPLMVPGAHFGLGRLQQSGHAPFPSALIAQPPFRD